MLGTLRIGLFVLFLFPCAICVGDSSGQMEAVSVSPDGKLMAVVYAREHTAFIYKVAIDTGLATRLTDAKTGRESSPTFSADGRQIAYSYSPGNGQHSRIMIGNVDGSNIRAWSPSDGGGFRPLFSPDGKTMILARSGFFGSYSPIAQPHPHDWSFYAAELDGTNMRQVTSEHFYMATVPSISPDGKTMAVVTEGLDAGRQLSFYSLERPGKPIKSTQLHVPREADRKDPIFNWPNYMPDGNSILFMAATNGRHGFDYDVYLTDLNSGALQRLTNGNGYATDLKVFADGKTAVFLRWHSNWRGTPDKNALYFLDLQSRKLTPFNVIGLN